ncbi:hypothetical protein ABTL30_20165, partial [Acinetobacter baumannii]
SNGSAISPAPLAPKGNTITARASATALTMAITSPGGRLTATALYPRAFLAEIARPSGYVRPFATDLIVGETRLPLEQVAGLGPL